MDAAAAMQGTGCAHALRADDAQRACSTAGCSFRAMTASRGYLPTRDLGPISVKQLLDIVRSAGEDGFLNPNRLPVSERVEQVLQQFEQSLNTSLQNVSIVELADDPAKNPALPADDRRARPTERDSMPHQRKGSVPTTACATRCDPHCATDAFSLLTRPCRRETERHLVPRSANRSSGRLSRRGTVSQTMATHEGRNWIRTGQPRMRRSLRP